MGEKGLVEALYQEHCVIKLDQITHGPAVLSLLVYLLVSFHVHGFISHNKNFERRSEFVKSYLQ